MKKGLKLAVLLGSALVLSLSVAACNNSDNTEDTTTTPVETTTEKKSLAEVGELVISGGQEYVYAPKAGATTVSAPFVVSVTDGKATEGFTDVKWEIISTSEGATIGADGVVTITDAYIYGDINGTDIIIQATSNKDASKKATATLHVREPQMAVSFDVEMTDAVRLGEPTPVVLTNIKDQYGEAIESVDANSIVWEFSDENMSVVNGNLVVRTRVDQPTFAALRANLNGAFAEKRFMIHNQDGYTVSADTKSELEKAEIKIIRNINVDFNVPRVHDTSKYIYVNKDVAGKTSLAVDVTGMVNYSANTDYQVTLLNADGTITQSDMRADAAGKVNVTWTGNVTAVEVTPVLKFSLGGDTTHTEADGYVKILAEEKYDGIILAGFSGSVNDNSKGVNMQSATDEGLFVTAVPDGFYNIRITKPKTARSTVTINGASHGTNVGNPGTGGRKGITPIVYLMEDVNIKGGTIRIGLGEKDWGLAAVEIRRTTTLTERRVHVYIGGDSTVSNYYPIESEEPAAGRYQTGWGQVFSQYVTDDIVVTDLAGGGTYAKSWYEMAFPGVIQNAQPGDYFIIQAGINDRSYSNQDEMVEYLTKMIDECRAKDIIVILVTTMQMPKFWGDGGEFGTPTGGGLAGYMTAMRNLAKEKNVFLADSGAITAEWYSQIGRTFVAQNYHIYNPDTNKEEDTLHLSYEGAKNVASVVATELARQKAEGVKDGEGKTLDGLEFNEIVDYTVEFTGKDGNKATATTSRVKAVYEHYAQ